MSMEKSAPKQNCAILQKNAPRGTVLQKMSEKSTTSTKAVPSRALVFFEGEKYPRGTILVLFFP